MQALGARKEWTEEALAALPRDGQKYELLGGELVVSPTGFQHGYISLRLATAITGFVLEHRLGIVVDSSTGFRMQSGDCLSPDVSFVNKERVRAQREITKRFFQGAPDLAVEVLSPGETIKVLDQKLVEYFANGTKLAWAIDPGNETVSVFHSPKEPGIVRPGDCLQGEEILPGFSFPVAELFEMPDFGS